MTKQKIKEKIHDTLEAIDKEYNRALKEGPDEANGYAHSYAIVKLLLKDHD